MMAANVEEAGAMLTAALEYAAKGKPVFPCNDEKQPRVTGGFLSATTDPEQVRRWWRQWPDATIGMPTGAVSGVIVIDLDVREGYDGGEAWSRLEAENGMLPDTVESLTPSGGRHLWYEHPGFEVRNSAGKLGTGIDVRGDGGYVIVPPSQLPDGRRYEWEGSNPRRPAALPAWGLKLLGQDIPPPRGTPEPAQASAESGRRNVYLASLAGKLAHAGLTREQIRPMVLAENQRACRPPLSEDEIDRTVMQSATKWVMNAGGVPVEDGPDSARLFNWTPASEWLKSMTAPEWILPGLLERATLNVIVGGWGAGKSAIELDKVLRICHGMPVQGVLPAPGGLWVYVVGEAQRGFQRRVAAWHQLNEREPTDRLVIIPEAVLIGQPDHEAALGLALTQIVEHYNAPITGVTLDTLARCFGLPDESSNSDVSRWVTSIQEHIVHPTGAAVDVLHHPGHGNKDRGRGASALPGATDVEWLVQIEGAIVVMRCTKNKDGAPCEPMAWEIGPVTLHIDGQSVTAPGVTETDVPSDPTEGLKPGSKQAQAVELLLLMLSEARDNLEAQGRPPSDALVEIRAWRERLTEEGVMKEGHSRQSFNSLVRALQEKDAVTIDGELVYPGRPNVRLRFGDTET